MGENEWRPAGPWLRVLDPATGEPIPVPDEQVHLEQQARLDAEDRADTEQQARLEAEDRADTEQQARLEAEQHARAAEQRAQVSEQRAQAAEAALAALLAQRNDQA